MEKNKRPEPKLFKILRIVSPCLLIIGVTLIVLATTVLKAENIFGEPDTNFPLLMVGIMVAFFSVPTVFFGFMPKIAKGMSRAAIHVQSEIAPEMIKATRDIQEESKEDLTHIANTNADISSEAITKTTRAIKKGLKNTKFCKHCGTEIDSDSKFCNSCGGEQ